MKLNKMIVLLTLITALLFAGTANAVEAPLFPSIYKGTVVDQTGKAVAAGTINAYIAENLKGSIEFTGGQYSRFLVQAETASINQPVVFKVVVNGAELEAVSSPNPVLWQSGKISGMDISAIKLIVDLTKIPAILPPSASQATGTYSGSIQVALSSATSGAAIYYTTDGTDPKTSASKKQYSSAITVDETTTLKAVAVLSGVFSEIKTFTYTIVQTEIQVTISSSAITMQVGAQRQLAVSTMPSAVSLQYKSSNTSVVSVSSSGNLTAKDSGSATITVTGTKSGLTSGSDTVSVTVAENPVSLTVYPESMILQMGETKQINVTTSPSGASVTYSSDDLNIAKVSSNGLVTAVGEGSAYIKVTAKESGYDDAAWSVAVKVGGQTVLPTTTFNDIPSGYWAYSTINNLARLGIAGGYQDGSFKPNNTITRAEFTKMLVKSLGLTDALSGPAKFSDVASGKWYFGSIQAAAAAGLISGDASGTFRPNANITRQEMAIVLVKALGMAEAAQSKANVVTTFKDDKTIAQWARGFTVTAVENGLVNGYPADNTFKPVNRATRAEACTMISRFLEKKV